MSSGSCTVTSPWMSVSCRTVSPVALVTVPRSPLRSWTLRVRVVLPGSSRGCRRRRRSGWSWTRSGSRSADWCRRSAGGRGRWRSSRSSRRTPGWWCGRRRRRRCRGDQPVGAVVGVRRGRGAGGGAGHADVTDGDGEGGAVGVVVEGVVAAVQAPSGYGLRRTRNTSLRAPCALRLWTSVVRRDSTTHQYSGEVDPAPPPSEDFEDFLRFLDLLHQGLTGV